MNKGDFLRAMPLAAAAAASTAATPAAAAPAARPAPRDMVVDAVQLPAWSDRAGQRIPLMPGNVVSTADEIATGPGAALALRLAEGSTIRLGESTHLTVPQMDVQPAEARIAVRAQLKLAEGFLRFTSTALAKVVGERRIDISVRSATIGIRGTDFWTMTDAAHDAACLFEGRIALSTRDQGELELAQPTAFWARFFDQPVRPVGTATPQELQKFLGSTELVPGAGVAVPGGRWRVVAVAARDAATAKVVAGRLRDQGYAAQIRAKGAEGRAVHEVRINLLASRADAEAVLKRIAGIEGVSGRVALAAA